MTKLNLSVIKLNNNKSPIDELTLNLVGIYLIICLVLCLVLNAILLLVFKRHKKLRTCLNMLILVMTVFNLVGSTEFPFMILNNFSDKWVWSELVCLITGFIHVFIGSFQSHSIAALSYLRLVIVRKSNNSELISKKKALWKAFLICFILSLFWALCPLVGWSYYSVEEHMLSCSIAHDEKNLNVVTYNICAFVFGFILPSCITIYTNLKSILLARRLRQIEPSLKNYKILKNDKKVTINILIYICK